MTRALVFAGSTRTDSLNRKLALAAAEELRRRGMEVTFAELRDYPLPMYDGDLESGSGVPEKAQAFRKLIEANDVLVIASPEYNGSFPAVVKNTIDWVSRARSGERPAAAFHGKTAVLLSASPGPGGGRRGLRHLRELLEMIGVTVVGEVAVPKAFEAFDAEGRLARGRCGGDRGDRSGSEGGLKFPGHALAVTEELRRRGMDVTLANPRDYPLPMYDGDLEAGAHRERPAAAFHGKTAVLLSASPGPGGGRRGLRRPREMLETIGVTRVGEVAAPKAFEAFDAEGRLAAGAVPKAA
jgi:chromate reductase, NAD(P)H dehydrogenase (quinone)